MVESVVRSRAFGRRPNLPASSRSVVSLLQMPYEWSIKLNLTPNSHRFTGKTNDDCFSYSSVDY